MPARATASSPPRSTSTRDYEGCELIFPEFGQRRYVAPYGGAIVFSCGALHQVTPVTRGKRYAFIPFLYGEDEAATRLANNALLAEGETHYTGERDRLYPEHRARRCRASRMVTRRRR